LKEGTEGRERGKEKNKQRNEKIMTAEGRKGRER
jgi:hypothetical protein